MTNILQAVIFDIDGTMIPNTPYHARAFIELGLRHNIEVTQADYRKRFHARSNKEIIQAMFSNKFGRQLNPVEVRALAEEKELIYRDLYAEHFQEMPGLSQIITSLTNSGIRCAAASNGPRANVNMAMNLLNLGDQLEFALAFEDVENGKPAPDLFIKAAQQLDTAPESCLVFEDSIHGFEAARAAGMNFIAVDSDVFEQASRQAPDALHVIKDYQGLSFEFLAEIFRA